MQDSDLVSHVLSTYSQSVSITCNTLTYVKAVNDDFVLLANLYSVCSCPMLNKCNIHLKSHLHRLKNTPSTRHRINNNNTNNNFIVQFIEWKYILHFGGCIKTQYLNHVVNAYTQ